MAALALLAEHRAVAAHQLMADPRGRHPGRLQPGRTVTGTPDRQRGRALSLSFLPFDSPAQGQHLRHVMQPALVDTPPHIVAARTGHTVAVLMETYAHVLKASGVEAAASIDNRLLG